MRLTPLTLILASLAAAVSNGAVAPQKSLDEPLAQSTLDAVDGVTRSPVAVPTQAYDDEGNHVSNIELDGTVADDVATAAALAKAAAMAKELAEARARLQQYEDQKGKDSKGDANTKGQTDAIIDAYGRVRPVDVRQMPPASDAALLRQEVAALTSTVSKFTSSTTQPPTDDNKYWWVKWLALFLLFCGLCAATAFLIALNICAVVYVIRVNEINRKKYQDGYTIHDIRKIGANARKGNTVAEIENLQLVQERILTWNSLQGGLALMFQKMNVEVPESLEKFIINGDVQTGGTRQQRGGRQ